MKAAGWLLEVYVRNDEGRAVLWVKTEEGRALRLTDTYTPALYIEPQDQEAAQHIYRILDRAPGVESLEWVEKKTSLTAANPTALLEAKFHTPLQFNMAVKALESYPHVKDLYNADLLHIQLYLFTKLRVEPTSKVELEYQGETLQGTKKLEDEYEIPPPPFTTLYFDIHPATRSLTPNPHVDEITSIEVVEGERSQMLAGSEPEILQQFIQLVRERDPDLLFTPEADEFTIPYLKTRAEIQGIKLQLGREEAFIPAKTKKPGLYICPGRVCLDYSNYGYTFDDSGWGIAGLVERARFACLPLGIAGRWTANRVNDSRICFELIKRGYVIPRNRGAFEFVRPLQQIYERDRGGMIISPKIGEIHYNVAELDFTSLYPHLIVTRNISFETITPEGHIQREDAILPHVVNRALERRMYFKSLREKFPVGCREWLWCEQRQAASKLTLVCAYGTSGCCWNRFGNVLAFEEINRTSREVMIKAKDHAQAQGFEVIYGDTDSLFLKKPRATREEYERLAHEISRLTGLPMSLDHHYKFLILLPLEGDPSGKMEAQKHYFGLLWNGEVLARGIELRRHDTPKFIKDFQERLIKTLFSHNTPEEVKAKGYEDCLRLVTEAIDQVMTGQLTMDDLVVSKILRKPLNQYRSLFPHVTAALQLASTGKLIKTGEAIHFIYRDADHTNPFCRTTPYELLEKMTYDREKYRDLLLDAAETILGPIGFTRELYGYKKTEPSNWLQQIYQERRKEAIEEVQFEETL